MTQQNNEEFEKWFDKQLDNGTAFTSEEQITRWAWQAAKADREREIAELRASNELLHDALESNQISEKELLSYREHINVLRDALEIAVEYQRSDVANFHSAYAGYKDEKHEQYDYDLKLVENALASTPAQSLQAHDYAVIERCAKLIEPNEEHRKDASWGYIGGEEGVELLDNAAESIRALKGKL